MEQQHVGWIARGETGGGRSLARRGAFRDYPVKTCVSSELLQQGLKKSRWIGLSVPLYGVTPSPLGGRYSSCMQLTRVGAEGVISRSTGKLGSTHADKNGCWARKNIFLALDQRFWLIIVFVRRQLIVLSTLKLKEMKQRYICSRDKFY